MALFLDTKTGNVVDENGKVIQTPAARAMAEKAARETNTVLPPLQPYQPKTSSSAPSPSSSPAPSTSAPSTPALKPIPDEAYSMARVLIQQGQLTPQEGQAKLQSLISNGQYGGGVDTGKLYAPMENIKSKDGSVGKFSNDGTGTVITTSRPTQSQTLGPGGQITNTTQPTGQSDQEFNQWLGGQNLSDDQRQAIQAIYDAVGSNDYDYARRIIEAMQAAAKFSDPYFKSQVRLVLDGLQRGLEGQEGDLEYDEGVMSRSLDALKADIAASKEQLTFNQLQEMKQLEQSFAVTLDNTQNDLASRGFTQSSRRAKTEGILQDNYEGMVESSNKNLQFSLEGKDRALATGGANIAAQIANVQRLAAEGKIDLLRKAEEQVGSSTLGGNGYQTLGNVGGEIPRAQYLDQVSFANNYVSEAIVVSTARTSRSCPTKAAPGNGRKISKTSPGTTATSPPAA